MFSSLPGLYPYTPSITDTGAIDPQSIHSKTSVFALALLTGALACTPFLLKKKPISWVFLGFGVVTSISYLFWSTLGQWIPNKIADQICIQHFLGLDPISVRIANRVVGNDVLHDEIFKQICSVPISNSEHRDNLLKHYLIGIWNHIPVKNENTLSYYLKAVYQMIGNQEITGFKPSTESQMKIWISDYNILDEISIKHLEMNFEINIKHEGQTPFSTLARKVIDSQNKDEKTWPSLLNRMTLLLNAGCDTTLSFEKRPVIDIKSPFGDYLKNILSTDENYNAASFLRQYLSKE